MLSPYTLRRAASPARPAAHDPPGAGPDCAEMARIIAERDFALAMQPVVTLSDRRIDHHEVFLRPLPSRVTLPMTAGQFVAHAAALDQGAALDHAVLHAARPLAPPVSVNMRARSLCQADAPDRVLRAWADSHCTLRIEIAGIAEVNDTAALTSAVLQLRAAGMRVALDDWDGSDVCLTLLEKTRFDALKFADFGAGARGRRLLAAFVDLAAAAGAVTIAKRVETLPQAWALQEAGVELAQGWLFGAPRVT